MSRPRWLSVLLAVFAGAATAATPAQKALEHLPDARFPAAHRVVSGGLLARDLPLLTQGEVREVINLRQPGETPDFDEGAAVAAAGIAYYDLPIGGAADLTRANVEKFDQLLRAAGDRLTLVHCASGNRVGAMIALRAGWIEGKGTRDAMAEGERWGLKGLAPEVRARIEGDAAR